MTHTELKFILLKAYECRCITAIANDKKMLLYVHFKASLKWLCARLHVDLNSLPNISDMNGLREESLLVQWDDLLWLVHADINKDYLSRCQEVITCHLLSHSLCSHSTSFSQISEYSKSFITQLPKNIK